MLEIYYRFQDFSKRNSSERQILIGALEDQVSHFTGKLTDVVRSKKLFSFGSNIIIYHHGKEKKVRHGFPFAETVTIDMESVAVQYSHDSGIYLIDGSVDGLNPGFKFKQMLRVRFFRNEKSYRPIGFNNEIVENIIGILREIPPSGPLPG